MYYLNICTNRSLPIFCSLTFLIITLYTSSNNNFTEAHINKRNCVQRTIKYVTTFLLSDERRIHFYKY